VRLANNRKVAASKLVNAANFVRELFKSLTRTLTRQVGNQATNQPL